MCIYPTILYGSQIWAPIKDLESKLRSTKNKMIRSATGVTLAERIKNSKLNKDFKIPDIPVEKQKLKWAGHTSRMDNHRWALKLTKWTPYDNKKSRGRKKTRWRDELRKKAGNNWMTEARN